MSDEKKTQLTFHEINFAAMITRRNTIHMDHIDCEDQHYIRCHLRVEVLYSELECSYYTSNAVGLKHHKAESVVSYIITDVYYNINTTVASLFELYDKRISTAGIELQSTSSDIRHRRLRAYSLHIIT